MKRFCVLFLAFALYGSVLHAAELTGRVIEASAGSAAVRLDSDLLPNAGDVAKIYFKLPGSEDEVVVGSSKVTAVERDVATVKFDDASLEAQKDQLARITSANPQKRSAAAQVATSAPSGAQKPELQGDDLVRAMRSSQDPTIRKILNAYDEASAQEALLLKSGFAESHPKIKAARGAKDVCLKQLSDHSRSVSLPPGDPVEVSQRSFVLSEPSEGVIVLPGATGIQADSDRGHVLYHEKKYAGAVAAYSKALRAEPDSTVASSGRIYAYAVMGEYDKAVADLEALKRRWPNDASVEEQLRTFRARASASKGKGAQ